MKTDLILVLTLVSTLFCISSAEAADEYIVTDWKIKETIVTLCIATAQSKIPDTEGVEFSPEQAKFAEDCVDWARENLDLRSNDHFHG